MATTKNKRLCPCPGLDSMAIGGIASAAGSVASSAIQALTQPTLRQQRESKQKYDAWYQQNVTEKNMAIENQYQIDAENRANSYNDPSAVAARYRAAGISPQSALGGAASGSGVQGSMSSGPDASGGGSYSPHPMAVRPDFSGLADSLLKGRQQEKMTDAQVDLLKAQTDKALKEAGYTEESRKRMVWENENILPEQLRGIKFDNLTKEQQAKIMLINAYIAEMSAEDDIQSRTLQNFKVMEEIESLKANRDFMKKHGKYLEAKEKEVRELLEPRKKSIEQDTKESEARTKTEDDLRDARVLDLLGELGIKEANIEKIWQEITDNRNGVPVGDDFKSAFVRFLYRRLGADQSISGTSYGKIQYNLGSLIRDFLESRKKIIIFVHGFYFVFFALAFCALSYGILLVSFLQVDICRYRLAEKALTNVKLGVHILDFSIMSSLFRNLLKLLSVVLYVSDVRIFPFCLSLIMMLSM